MMGKQKKDSPPFTPANGKISGFKIPKKKTDDWCEDVQASSPLSRANPDFRNVTFRKRAYASSYESYNVPRNKDTHAHGSYKLNRHPKVILTDILRSDSGRQSAQTNITGSNSYNDATFQISPISSPTSKSSPPYQVLKAFPESLCLSRTEHNIGLQIEEEPYREKESDAKYPEKRCSLEPKEQAQETPCSKVCRDVSNTSITSPKDFNSGPRKSGSLEQGSPISAKAAEQECKTPIKNNMGSPNTREKTYCCKRAEQRNKKTSLSPLNVPVQNASSSSDLNSDFPLHSTDSKIFSKDGLSEENKETFHVDPPAPSSRTNTQTNRLCKRKIHKKDMSRENVFVEPIVLSSDEEERRHEESVSVDCVKAIKEPSIEMKDDVREKQCPSPSNDAVPMLLRSNAAALFERITAAVLDLAWNRDAQAKVKDCSATLVDTIPAPECPVLQLKFLNLYFGKSKGRATDSAKFTTKSIEIPLRVALHKSTCITVETRNLKKYGLWLTNGGDSIRSSAVIVLWIATDYIPHFAKQMESPPRNQASKSDELIFLELVEPLTSKEQCLICEIMKEASKNDSPTLSEILSWDEMYSMLEALPYKECSFKENCYLEFKNQQKQESSCASPAVNPPEAPRVKSSYSLMQECKDGHYSVSVLANQDNTLKEIQRVGSVMRLLVYPPPPTKGGLGVTNEDLDCLEHGEFLNDVIIDFYLKYLMLEKFPKYFAEKCHIFSSFFYRCLTRKDNVSNDNHSGMPTAERRHHRVKTWTRHVDIFTKDFIFVPVNENSHWYLAVICFPWMEKAVYEDRKGQNAVQHTMPREASSSGSVIVFSDHLSKKEETTGEGSNSGSEGSNCSGYSYSEEHPKPKENRDGKLCKRPCLLIFDSLKTGSVQTTVQVLREYLKVEWDVKHKTPRNFSRSMMRDLYPKVPKQNNSTDCGLYLLQYVESFSQKPIENFDPPMHLENWFPACVVKNKREEIRDLILQLHVQQTKKS